MIHLFVLLTYEIEFNVLVCRCFSREQWRLGCLVWSGLLTDLKDVGQFLGSVIWITNPFTYQGIYFCLAVCISALR